MAGLLNFVRSVHNVSIKKLAVAGVVLAGGAFTAYRLLKYRSNSTLLNPVLKKLEEGTKPYIPLTHMVERKDIWEAIEHTFLIGTGRINEGFGIIFGPSGSGKTIAIRKVCNNHPKGVIYVELKGWKEDYSFIKQMVDQLGLKVKPTGLIDFTLMHFSSTYNTHHQLPKDPWASMDYIFDILIGASQKYKLKHRQMPVITASLEQ